MVFYRSLRSPSLSAPDLHRLFQQMGEVLSGLRALRDTGELRQEQAEQLHAMLRGDMSGLKKDQQELEEKLDCVICVMQHDLEALRSDAAETARSIHDLAGAVRSLRGPLADIIALRSRVAGLLLGVGLFGSAALWLAEPVYHWAVEELLTRR